MQAYLMRTRYLLLALVCLFMGGCSLLKTLAVAPPVLPLLDPAQLGRELQMTQAVTATFNGEQRQMLAVWAVEKGVLTFVGMTPTGQTLMTLEYDGEHYKERFSELMDKPIDGRMLLAQLQMVYWPREVVLAALKETPWRMSLESNKTLLFYQDTLFMTVETSGLVPGDRFQQAYLLSVPRLGFSLAVKTLQVEES